MNKRRGFAVADDGRRIYWRAIGSGPLLACCNGVGVSTFFWKYLVRHYRDRFTVVLWDYRGHGISDRSVDPRVEDLSIGRHASDLASVLDDVDPEGGPAVVVGHSMGCQVALELRRLRPERVRAIVLILGTAGRALETFFDYPGSPRIFKVIHRAAFAAGNGVNEVMRPLLWSPLAWLVARKLSLVDPYYARQEDMVPYMRHLASLDLRVFLESALQCQQHDAWDLLPELQRPLLVIAAENDKFTPLWCSHKIADTVPGADILVLADASHAAIIEQPETINRRIDRWLTEKVEA